MKGSASGDAGAALDSRSIRRFDGGMDDSEEVGWDGGGPGANPEPWGRVQRLVFGIAVLLVVYSLLRILLG